MKKIIKKITVAFLAMALVLAGMLVADKKEASAAGEQYFLLGEGFPGAAWGSSSTADMTDNGDGTYSYTFTVTQDDIDKANNNVVAINFKVAERTAFGDGNWGTAISDGKGSNFQYTVSDPATVKITYDATVTDRAGVSVTGATNTKTYGPYTAAYFAGDEALCGSDWSLTDCPMTLDDGIFSITFNDVAAGPYYYKVIGIDAKTGDHLWENDYIYGLRDAKQSGNGVITVAQDDSIVTVTFNQLTYAVEVVVSAPEKNPAEEATTEAPTTEAPTTEAPTTEAPTSEVQDETAEAPTSGEGTGTGSDVESGDSNVGMICGILALLAAAGVVTVVVAKKRIVEE